MSYDRQEETTVRNAVVAEAEIYRDLTTTQVSLKLNYGSAGDQDAGRHELTPGLVRGLMEVAGATRWSEISGKIVRARVSPALGVVAVGHVIEDTWLDLVRALATAEDILF